MIDVVLAPEAVIVAPEVAGTRLKPVANSWMLAAVEAGAEAMRSPKASASIRRCSSRPSRAAGSIPRTCG